MKPDPDLGDSASPVLEPEDVVVKSKAVTDDIKVGMVQQALLAVAARNVRIEVSAHHTVPPGKPYLVAEFFDIEARGPEAPRVPKRK